MEIATEQSLKGGCVDLGSKRSKAPQLLSQASQPPKIKAISLTFPFRGNYTGLQGLQKSLPLPVLRRGWTSFWRPAESALRGIV